jgi:hypothetical protein
MMTSLLYLATVFGILKSHYELLPFTALVVVHFSKNIL